MGDVERANQNRDPSYCGSCYGASPPESGSVRTALDNFELSLIGISAAATHVRRSGRRTSGRDGPSAIRAALSRYVSDLQAVPHLTGFGHQCVEEGWIDKVKEQNTEGCRLSGRVRVNKVRLHSSFLYQKA